MKLRTYHLDYAEAKVIAGMDDFGYALSFVESPARKWSLPPWMQGSCDINLNHIYLLNDKNLHIRYKGLRWTIT